MDVVKMLSKEKGIKLFQIAREVIRCSQAGKEGNCKAYPDGNCGKKEQGGGKMKKTFKLTVKFLYFTDEVNARGKKGRTECIARILSDWRAEGKFPQAMKRRLPSPLSIFTCNSQPSSVWMDEMFPIYASPKSSMFNASKPATRELFGNIASKWREQEYPCLDAKLLVSTSLVRCLLNQEIELTKYDTPTKVKEKT